MKPTRRATLVDALGLRPDLKWSEPAAGPWIPRHELFAALVDECKKHATSFAIHYSEIENAWRVEIVSAAPAECYGTKNRTDPDLAVLEAIEWLRAL